MYKCDNCGHEAKEGANFCLECGSPLQKTKPTKTERKKRVNKTYNFTQKTIQQKSGVPGWMKILGVVVVAIVAYFFLMNDSSEPYGDEDYSAYTEPIERADESDDSNDYEYADNVISENTNPELERVKQEYEDAFTKYTELVTTGGEGDVQEALKDYKEKYQKYKQLSSGGSTSPDEIDLSDLSSIDGIEDIPSKTAETTKGTKVFTETLIHSETVNAGQMIIKTEGIIVHIQSGTFSNVDKELKIYKIETDRVAGEVFELDLSDAPLLFKKPVEIEIPLKKGDNPKHFAAFDEIDEDMWMIIPSEYDRDAHSIKFKTHHFSEKGIINYIDKKISGLESRDFRYVLSGAAGSIATGLGIIVVVGAGTASWPVTGVVLAGGFLAAETDILDPVTDPVVDEIIKLGSTDLNTTFKLTDGLSVSWVDNKSSSSHLGGEKIMVCVDRSTNKILFAMPDDMDSKKRAAVLANSVTFFPKFRVVNIPKVILNLVVEMKIIKNYYKEKGYKVPPTTDMWIYKMSDAGGWNGTKLEIHTDYFENERENTKASRMITLSHEYWHSVYEYNKYDPDYKWLDECLATSFEGQVSPWTEKWYDQSIIPYDEQFYNRYKVDDVAESMRTGLIFSGTEGKDSDLIQRGYQLWPWGKFLLANQGHQEIQEMLSEKISTKQLSAYFRNYCRSLLTSDFAVSDMIDENILLDNNSISYNAPSGWSKLPPSKFISKATLSPGNLKNFISSKVFLKPIPLSLNLFRFESRGAATNTPFIIRRNKPDDREEFMIIPSSVKADGNGRYPFYDVITDNGIIVLPSKYIKEKLLKFQLAIINMAVEENWSEYFGYGENPIYAYFLRPPKEVVLNEVASKLQLGWQVPGFDYGLSEDHILSGYNIYVTDGKSVALLTSVGKDQKSVDLRHVQLAGYTKIGVASVDKLAKDEKGQPLTSEINWIPIKMVGGSWVKVNVSYGYTMGDKEGSEATAEHSDWGSGYKYKIGMGSATTSNSNNGRNTVDVENASFSHSWSSIPDVLQPGKVINQSISVVNNGSSGKNAMTLYGKTSFNIYSGDISEEVSAGGSFYKDIGTWENESSKQFKWTVPKPDYMTLADPKKNRMKISIAVSSSSGGETKGYCTIEYEYRP